MTNPQADACVVWFDWLLPMSNQDQEDDQDDVDALPEDIEGESPPYLIEEGSELNDSPIPDSVREIWDGSWSSGGGVEGLSGVALGGVVGVVFFFGRGGNSFLLSPPSWVGDALPEIGCTEERLECLLEECTGIGGGSPFMVPGHGIATETSLHWKYSWEVVVIVLFFPAAEARGSSRFQTYTWESSLAHIMYFPLGVNDAPIWLLVFRKPVSRLHIQVLLTRILWKMKWYW